MDSRQPDTSRLLPHPNSAVLVNKARPDRLALEERMADLELMERMARMELTAGTAKC